MSPWIVAAGTTAIASPSAGAQPAFNEPEPASGAGSSRDCSAVRQERDPLGPEGSGAGRGHPGPRRPNRPPWPRAGSGPLRGARRSIRGGRPDRGSPGTAPAGLRPRLRPARGPAEGQREMTGSPSPSTLRPADCGRNREQVMASTAEGPPASRPPGSSAAPFTPSRQSPECPPERTSNRSNRPVAGMRTAWTASTTAPCGPW